MTVMDHKIFITDHKLEAKESIHAPELLEITEWLLITDMKEILIALHNSLKTPLMQSINLTKK